MPHKTILQSGAVLLAAGLSALLLAGVGAGLYHAGQPTACTLPPPMTDPAGCAGHPTYTASGLVCGIAAALLVVAALGTAVWLVRGRGPHGIAQPDSLRRVRRPDRGCQAGEAARSGQ